MWIKRDHKFDQCYRNNGKKADERESSSESKSDQSEDESESESEEEEEDDESEFARICSNNRRGILY